MAMIKVSKTKEEESDEKESSMTPAYIQGKLFSFHDMAHKFHLETKKYEIHKTLDDLYKDLVKFKDEISEKLMGYLGGKRIGKIKLDDIPEYSDSQVMTLAKNIQDFGYDLYEWAEENKYCDISNIAQSLSGLGAETVYLLTLT